MHATHIPFSVKMATFLNDGQFEQLIGMNAYLDVSDRQLVSACRKGKPDAWEALIGRYERLVYAVPRKYGLNSAECDDVFQATWAQLLTHLPRLKQPDRIAAWLVTTAKHLSWDQRRGGEATKTDSVDPHNFPKSQQIDNASPEHLVEEIEQHARLRSGLNRLGARCRQLLQALYFDPAKTSYADLSDQLEIPVGAIGPTRARCLQKLRKELS